MSFAFGYLFDENFPPAVPRFLRLHRPSLPVSVVGDGVAPPKSTPDPDILIWCEAHGRVLVTNNRSTMPGHLRDHVAAGRSVEGIFHLGADMTVAELGEHLAQVADLSLPGEYRNTIRFLPIR